MVIAYYLLPLPKIAVKHLKRNIYKVCYEICNGSKLPAILHISSSSSGNMVFLKINEIMIRLGFHFRNLAEAFPDSSISKMKHHD